MNFAKDITTLRTYSNGFGRISLVRKWPKNIRLLANTIPLCRRCRQSTFSQTFKQFAKFDVMIFHCLLVTSSNTNLFREPIVKDSTWEWTADKFLSVSDADKYVHTFIYVDAGPVPDRKYGKIRTDQRYTAKLRKKCCQSIGQFNIFICIPVWFAFFFCSYRPQTTSPRTYYRIRSQTLQCCSGGVTSKWRKYSGWLHPLRHPVNQTDDMLPL